MFPEGVTRFHTDRERTWGLRVESGDQEVQEVAKRHEDVLRELLIP
jgi:hypothetical protein